MHQISAKFSLYVLNAGKQISQTGSQIKPANKKLDKKDKETTADYKQTLQFPVRAGQMFQPPSLISCSYESCCS